MTLTGNKDDVALFGQHAGCTDGLATVDDAQHLLHLFRVEACQHIVDDGLRLLEAGIVAGDNDTVTLTNGFLSHERTLALVAIATGTADGDDATLSVEHLMNGVEYVLEGIGCVRIVDDGSEAFR